ncbi:inhibitor of apoptosis 5 [Epinotia aporema granulovirus]|uniref:Inhibitor of apoptosis 5 n=1 Tax=Epinotia aporema granulovirus TaxID=166056 RepID=K4EQ33_9BBAC|nr:inhibitor of apoptosis 5 [Epinotia aporema granulovirus]AER41537.1 inhibitor of apoptosis 5 [Epinotia aporema granulovirus]
MDKYETRLDSFAYWTGNENKEKLALLGFYYSGEGDRVICAFCKLDLYNFFGDFDTIQDHKRFSPHCPANNNTDRPHYVPSNFISPRVINSNYPSLNIPVGNFALMEHRLDSYKNFPKSLKPLVYELSNSGFYYTNVGDCVCCYVCGIILRDWCLTDDVSKRHVRHNSKCDLIDIHPNNDDIVTPSAPPLKRVCIQKCVVCEKNDICAVFTPCFHLCVCEKCALGTSVCYACNVTTAGFFLVNSVVGVRSAENEHNV